MKKFCYVISLILLSVVLFCGCSSKNKLSSGEIPEEIHEILPSTTVLLLTMNDTHSDYDFNDPDFVWKSLYYFFARLDTTKTKNILVPRNTVRKQAETMFLAYDELPAIPSSLNSLVEYHTDTDAYIFHAGDKTICKGQITGCALYGEIYTLETEIETDVKNGQNIKGIVSIEENRISAAELIK